MRILPQLAVLALALSSCNHVYYVPNCHNVPLCKDKDELHLTASAGGGENAEIFELQSAYSVTDKIAVMANAYYAHGGKKSENYWGQGWYVEGAAGYYKPITDLLIFEVYGGIGLNNQSHYYNNPTPGPPTTLTYSKIFVQPNIGVSLPYLDVAFSTKFGQVAFYDYYDPNHQAQIDGMSIKGATLAYEPAITLRTGWKAFKLQVQLSGTRLLNYDASFFNETHLSIGLHYTLGRKYASTTSQSSDI